LAYLPQAFDNKSAQKMSGKLQNENFGDLNSEEYDEYIDVKPNKRIDSLKAFYVNVKRGVNMTNVDNKTKNFTEDMKGQWVTEQFILAAKTLCVIEFVAPLSRDGVAIPVIPEVEKYEMAFRQVKMETMTDLQDVIEMRDEYVKNLRTKLRSKRETMNKMKATSEEDEDPSRKEAKEKMRLSFEDESSADSYDSDYRRWQKEALALQQDKQKIVDWEEKLRKEANIQYNEDQDALSRMTQALSDLKVFLDKLMRKVPEVEDYVRNKNEDDCDPFDEGDMRTCLTNLLDRYRRDDKMGVLTTIMAGMKESQQKGQDLTSYFRVVENWIMELTRLHVNEISIKDMGAIIYLQGMHEKHRKEFLNQQNIMEITLEDRDSSSVSEDGRSVRNDQSLYRKVRTFTKGVADSQLVNKKLNGYKAVMADRNGNQKQNEKETEAQNAFSIKGDKERGICYKFASSGTCDRENCSFKHEKHETAQGVCWKWQNTGKCDFGAKCRFKHEESKAGGGEKESSQEKAKKSDMKKVSTNVFSMLEEEDDSEGGCETNCCVIVKRTRESSEKSVYSVNEVEDQKPIYLGWDTMASINVASDLGIIPGAQKVQNKKNAQGLGGELAITHEGRSPLFGLEMKYIEGGETPHLASVASQLLPDKDGETGIAIFTVKGAVRLRANEDMHRALAKFVDKAQERGRVEGHAMVRNGVYLEKFDCGEQENTPQGDQDHVCAVTSMYAHRSPLSTEDEVVGMLATAGVSQDALMRGIKNKTIAGIPASVTVAHVKGYFEKIGKDRDLLMADIHTALPHKQTGYVPDKTDIPGEILQIDNVDPSFSRLIGERMSVKSIAGYRDAIVGLDGATGFCHIEGRQSKKDPEKVLHKFMKIWIAKWQSLKLVKCDKEFVTVASQVICTEENVGIRMAVPQDHKRGLAMAEGFLRWLQDMAQGSMNRLIHLVTNGKITELQRKSMWYHALRLAAIVSNMKQSNCDPTKTRWEEGHGEPFNLAHIVVLPFGLPVISRRLHSGPDGRGEEGIYVGPSVVVKGGILVFTLRTGRISQKYTFLPREEMPLLEDLDLKHAAKHVYGDLQQSDQEDSKPIDDTSSDKVMADVRGDVANESEGNVSDVGDNDSITISDNGDKVEIEDEPPPDHRHFTRSKHKGGPKVLVVMDRPAKPQLPGRQKRKTEDRWIKASKREQQKLIDEEVLRELPVDSKGDYVFPEDCLIMRLFQIDEFKWKKDPDEHHNMWLECSRIVLDGSDDKRVGETTYAETPDRTVLLLMISVGATTREVDMTADAVRAYLNALSIDRNIVVCAPRELEMLPRMSMLHKGLYGSTKGALSFQVWVDEKLNKIGYKKCQSARSVYIKKVHEEMIRLLRHSDDFRLSTQETQTLKEESKLLGETIRLSEFKPTKRFLGICAERISHLTGSPDERGRVVLLNMTEKIEEMGVKFKDLSVKYNSKSRIRRSGLPDNPIREDEELGQAYSVRLGDGGIKRYMSLVGLLQWITAGIRFDCRYSYYVVSIRLSNPREWDMYMAVWLMDFIVGTKHRPLVLGGPEVDPEVMCDSSFATLPKRRTVKSHVATTCNGSGAIYACVGAVKNAIKSIWEGELMAGSDGSDTIIYLKKVLKELEYLNIGSNKVKIDSQSVLDWIDSDKNNKHSRHVDIRLHNARDRAKDGSVSWEYVNTLINIADILTKSLGAAQFEYLSGKILGHDLVAGLGIIGVVDSGEEGIKRYKELWGL
jgi:hypothetical protein